MTLHKQTSFILNDFVAASSMSWNYSGPSIAPSHAVAPRTAHAPLLLQVLLVRLFFSCSKAAAASVASSQEPTLANYLI
jgi:hypothetical protein